MKEDKDLLKELLQTKFKDDVMESSGNGFVHVFDAVQENSGNKSSFLWYIIGGIMILLIGTLSLFYVLKNKTFNTPIESTSVKKETTEILIKKEAIDFVTQTNDQITLLVAKDKNDTIKGTIQTKNNRTPIKVDVTTITPENDSKEKGVITVTYKASEKYAATEHTKYNTLPDLSTIVVRKNSTVNFTASKQGYRKVDITGTAFLSIQKDESKPFIVFGRHCKIQVSGNSFAIHSDAKADLMTLIAGTAKVVHNTTKEVIDLVPGQSLQVDNSGISLLKKSPNQFAWKTASLYYENARIHDVIKDLGENYDAKIQIKNTKILQCTYSGFFEHANTIKVLKEIVLSLNLQISKKEDVFIITGKGCSK